MTCGHLFALISSARVGSASPDGGGGWVVGTGVATGWPAPGGGAAVAAGTAATVGVGAGGTSDGPPSFRTSCMAVLACWRNSALAAGESATVRK